MLKLVLKHEGKDISCKVPSSWEEVTLAQFLALHQMEPVGSIGVLHALTGIDLSTIENTKTDLPLLMDESLRWFFEDIEWRKLSNKVFTYAGKSYDVPKNLELERFGQKAMLQDKLAEIEEGDYTTIVSFAVALYMQPVIYGTFDGKQIDALEKEILHKPVKEVYPVAAFFLKKSRKSMLLGVPILPQFQPYPTRPANS